jgi:hypothetical protein
MKFSAIKSTFFAAAAAVTLTAMPLPAHADIDEWLRRNFSTKDFIGDWLRDTFRPANNNGGGGGFDSPSIQTKGYQQAVEIMAKWPKSKGERKSMEQVCSGEQLLNVVLETKSQEKTVAKCFKEPRPTRATGKATEKAKQ